MSPLVCPLDGAFANEPAGAIQPRSGTSGGARESRSGLASRFSARVGFAYRNPGLQAAVCNKTSRCSLFSNRRKRRTHSERGNFLPPKQGSDSDGATQSDKPWFLFLVLSLSKRRGAPPLYIGPLSVEQTFKEIQFQNVTQGSLARAIKQNDWFTSVDLNDAFFHISIYPPHRKYIRFAYQGICYEFTVLPFGCNLSPRTFCVRRRAWRP